MEPPGEESHSAVEMPAIVRGSRVPADAAGKVPAKEGCSSMVQADPTRGKREEGGGLAKQQGSTNTEDGDGSQFFERRPYRSCNSGESAIPESRATRATTSLIDRN